MLKDFVKLCKPLPSNAKLLIFGAGFSGSHVANLARKLGTQVICSRRKIDSPGADFVFNSSIKKLPAKNEFSEVTHLLSCIPPDTNGDDPVLKSLKSELEDMPLKWVGYLSSTGVYGDYKGEWVSESDVAKSKLLRSQRRLACEQTWQKSGLPIQILRLPGIYGPGRSAIETIEAGKAKMIDKPQQVFSRVHIDDIAGSIFHLINLASKGQMPEIINIADNLPSTNIDVMRYAATLLNSSLPAVEPYHLAKKEMSPMALSFWQENRRVSNNLLCNGLGYSLIHPNYKSGLDDCLQHYRKNSS